MKSDNRPIGIFDSGIGGLTLANALHKLLPNERIVYFGDTAHLPYGDKSSTAIQAYSIKICNVLLQQNCKAILIACNSASAAAYDLVKLYVGSKAKVYNVIDPIVNYLSINYNGSKVGLIGTKQTIFSNAYKTKIDHNKVEVDLRSLATPLLAPMIEEGFFSNSISYSIIENYLNNEELSGISALILGCTHYPLIKKEIEKFYGGTTNVLDTAQIVAKSIKDSLTEANLLAVSKEGEHHFYVSDFTNSFQESTKLFFGKSIGLELYKIWD